MSVIYYNQLQDFTRALAAIPTSQVQKYLRAPRVWNGNQTFEEARENIYKGNQKAAERAAKLMWEIAGDSIETEQTRWEYDYVGHIPCVPSYLAGEPLSMRRPVSHASVSAPMRVFASVAVSEGLNAKELEARGVAILALCQKLQATRPVELWVYADLQGYRDTHDGAAIPCVRLDTSPLDLTTASYILTNPGFLRQICFIWGRPYGFQGKWAWQLDPTSSEAARKRREAFQATDDDLIIPGGFQTDPIVREPVKWLNEQIRKFAPGGEQT